MPKTINWKQLEEEMSIAGNPVKITNVTKVIYDIINLGVDHKAIPELMNIQMGLELIVRKLKNLEQAERDRQHPPMSST